MFVVVCGKGVVIIAIPRMDNRVAVVLVADFDGTAKTVSQHRTNKRRDSPVVIQFEIVIQHYRDINIKDIGDIPVGHWSQDAFGNVQVIPSELSTYGDA